MPRIFSKAAFGLTILALGAGMAVAQAADPMQALRGRVAAEDPLDPMSALRATKPATEALAANEELGGLPDAPGAEETYYQCVACHSTEIIKQQRVTDLRWDELWTWMIDSQGMPAPDDETKTIILGYLKTHFSSER